MIEYLGIKPTQLALADSSLAVCNGHKIESLLRLCIPEHVSGNTIY